MCLGPKTFHHENISPRVQVVEKAVCPLLIPPQTIGSCMPWVLQQHSPSPFPGPGLALCLKVTQVLSGIIWMTGHSGTQKVALQPQAPTT